MIKKTLYFGNPAYLSLKNEQLVLRFPEIEKVEAFNEEQKNGFAKTFPIEDIGIIVLDNKQITITQGLLEKLLLNNCAVITCDSTKHPLGLLLPLEGNTIQNERFRAQIEASLPLKKQLWQQTVQQKIINQATVLSNYCDNAKVMYEWAKNVKSGDPENIEARAAAHYWKYIFPKELHFFRAQEGEPPNNLLNYGYAILRAIIARSLVSSGLLPTLGIHHHNRYNAYCLADDIMEPYRPYIDRLVLELLFQEKDISIMTTGIKKRLLSISTMDVLINEERSPLMIAATTTAASLSKCFNGEIRKIIYPEII